MAISFVALGFAVQDQQRRGLPACVVPIGLGDDGLPVALQVVGPRGADGAVLAAAEAIEAVLGFDARLPEPMLTLAAEASP